MFKRISFKKKVFLVSLLVFSVLNFPLSSEDWILAAQEFTFKQPKKNSESVRQAAKVLPQLILEQISSGEIRNLPEREVLNRKLNTLQTERLSLFLQLSKENQNRDALVLKTLKPKELEKLLVEENKKIIEIQKKIIENLEQAETEKKNSAPFIEIEERTASKNIEKDKSDKKFPFPFFKKDDEQHKIVSENVSFYKNDTASLFQPSGAAIEDGHSSWTFSKEVLNAKINGLLTGNIISYGDYAAVTVELLVFPGCKSGGVVTEVGMLSDLLPLASNIAQNMNSKIVNSLPVVLDFEIEPYEAYENAVISIDGIVYQLFDENNDDSNKIIENSGIHTITIESPGYEKASATYQFTDDTHFKLKVSLVPEVSGVAKLRMKKYRDGVFYANGLNSYQSKENEDVKISVNGKTILGIFKMPTGEFDDDENEKYENAFFRIKNSLSQDDKNLIVNVNPFDRAANIDKRRRRMYTAYTALICSMPFTFFSVGNYTAENIAMNNGRGSQSSFSEWETKMYITGGISIVCGAWFAFELVRYLYAANQVLPAEVRVNKKANKMSEVIETKEIMIENTDKIVETDE